MNTFFEKINAIQGTDNKKSILLIDFNSLAEKNNSYYFYSLENQKSYALGITRIYEYLLNNKVKVCLLHYTEIIDKAIDKTVIADFDIIGVNALSNMAFDCFNFCVKIKNVFPEKIIVGGGEHYALDYDWILKNKNKTGCDICCTFQGELTMLALAKNMKYKNIGSIAYFESETVIINNKYPVMSDDSGMDLLKPAPILNYIGNSSLVAFPEFSKIFNSMGLTQTGSGCIYSCDFCTNKNFMGVGFNNTLKTSFKEIQYLKDNNISFFFVNNALINSNSVSFNAFLDGMIEINATSNHTKMNWAAFMSVRRSKKLQEFEKMGKAGCLMINVGVEDMLGDRKKLKKGEDIINAITFINEAKKYLLVRALLILGLPSHYYYTREDIKKGFLNFMKSNPMAIYRINYFTPIVGTQFFSEFGDTLIDDFRENIEFLKQFDTMHSVIEPSKMYQKLDIPVYKRWLKNSNDWILLQNEIMFEYLNSSEHNNFLDLLKSKNIQYQVALNFKSIILNN